jgi:hypothetical protein
MDSIKKTYAYFDIKYVHYKRYRSDFSYHGKIMKFQKLPFAKGIFFIFGYPSTKLITGTLQMFTGYYGVSAGFPCCGETL